MPNTEVKLFLKLLHSQDVGENDMQPKSSLPQLQTISPCPVIIYPSKELTPLLFIGSL